MRIVAGSLKGRAVQAPDGTDTRPTTDRVREALFSSLYSQRGGFEGAVVLDAFAGSGALGIEALSRGAESCTFCELDPKAAAVVRRNVRACGIEGRSLVLKRDALAPGAVPSAPQGPYDLVFLDPPYAYAANDVLQAVTRLRDAGVISSDALVVYEHALKDADAVAQAAQGTGLALVAAKKYGKTGVSLLQM